MTTATAPKLPKTKTSIVDVIRAMYEMNSHGAYFHDADNMDEARAFAEGIRKIVAEEDAPIHVEQRNTKVLMSLLV